MGRSDIHERDAEKARAGKRAEDVMAQMAAVLYDVADPMADVPRRAIVADAKRALAAYEAGWEMTEQEDE